MCILWEEKDKLLAAETSTLKTLSRWLDPFKAWLVTQSSSDTAGRGRI